ncbi:MAG: helix-turn-helix transcriptional regulator [Actinomycetota bacterium]|nr:helix-turn-helix transcriptional regulator [Actinomycetota bacterium]
MAVLRTLIGEALRTTRLRQRRTLREVSSAARVSLGYLSEVERGQKEASSELLASICRALGVRLSDVLRDVSETLSVIEPLPAPVSLPAVPDTLPDTLPALEPVGADDHAGGAVPVPVAAGRHATVRAVARDVVAAA